MAWYIKENLPIYLKENMKRNNSYIYPKTVRETIDGQRHYLMSKEKLPSVTTILAATESLEKTEALAKWRESKGEENAMTPRRSSGARPGPLDSRSFCRGRSPERP